MRNNDWFPVYLENKKAQIGDTVGFGLSKDEIKFFENAMKAGIGWAVGLDWHEPDQIDLDAKVVGKAFDNAGIEGEKHVVLLRGRGKNRKEIGRLNLATVLALAMAAVRKEGHLSDPRRYFKL